MTIKFNCPNCGELIAFDSKHCGKRAHCTTCKQQFIIPSKNNETPEKIEPEEEGIENDQPVPGFYRAVFIESWKIFVDPKNTTSLVFVAALICFKFFLSCEVCCIYIVFFVAWGWLIGFYLNIIYETAFGTDTLPSVYIGTFTTFFWYLVKPFFIFFFTLIVVHLPFIIALVLVRDKGITYENMWQWEIGLRLVLQVLFILGLFFFPMAILTIAIGKDITMLRPDYILSPVFKAPAAYIVVVTLLVIFGIVEMQTQQFSYSARINVGLTLGRLALNLGLQVIAIIAMRSIGLFYRHYTCHLPW
ncbi:MAG: hypothetical protein ACYS1A_01500 [Planctomycetota bacterium]|jgi:hypothetical protein